MVERLDVVIIGAGQAGLAMSWQLRERGMEHVVLERGRVGQRWRTERWDSWHPVPQLVAGPPGLAYDGPEPDGFAHYSEVLARIERYAALQSALVREQVEVHSVTPADSGAGWVVTTGGRRLACRAIVLATGPFQKPLVPAQASGLPSGIVQIHSSHYRNPGQLPPGGVLVVGSGGSGAQIAEELLEAGRRVHLAVNRCRRIPRRYRGQDVLWWLLALGVMDRTKADWPDGRMPPSLLVTGVEADTISTCGACKPEPSSSVACSASRTTSRRSTTPTPSWPLRTEHTPTSLPWPTRMPRGTASTSRRSRSNLLLRGSPRSHVST